MDGIKLLSIDDYTIEGWQHPEEREYVNFDSLSMQISIYNVNFTAKPENRPVTIIVLFISALFIVALTRSFTCLTNLDESQNRYIPPPQRRMMTRLQRKKEKGGN
jgi:hypothetical protein